MGEILRAPGIEPAPERDRRTWAAFLRGRAHAILACDLFTAATLNGATVYVFAVIEHAGRRIRILGATARPTADGGTPSGSRGRVTQAARNLVMDIQDAGAPVTHLIPAFGRLKLADLRFRHIVGWVEAELARGRGRTSVYRANATLSSALSHAVRTRLMADNPARFAFMPRPVAPERLCWTPAQAAAFLRHNRTTYADQFADLFAAARHWDAARRGTRPALGGRASG